MLDEGSIVKGKPVDKQADFRWIVVLDEHDAIRLGTALINGHMSLTQAQQESQQICALQRIRADFVQLTGSKSWEHAQECYCSVASDGSLLQWCAAFEVLFNFIYSYTWVLI